MKSEGISIAFVLWYLERIYIFFSFPHFSKCTVIIHSSVPGVVVCKMATVRCNNYHQKVEPGSSPLKSRGGLVTFC